MLKSLVMAQPSPTQMVPQPVVPAGPRVYTPSPTYDKYIPVTPKPTSSPYDQPPKVYQFYKYAPAPFTPESFAPSPALTIQEAPAFSTINTLIQPVLSTVAAPTINVENVTPDVMPRYDLY